MSSPIMNAIQQICLEKGISTESVIETIESALAAAYRKDFGQKNQNIKVKFNPATGGAEVFDVKIVMDKPPEEEEVEVEALTVEESAPAAGTQKSAIDQTAQDSKKTKDALPKDDASLDNTKNDKLTQQDGSVQESAEEVAVEESVIRFNPKLHLTLEEAQAIKPKAKIGDEIITQLEVPAAYGRMAAQTAKQVIIQKLREAERETLYDEYKQQEGEVINGVVQRKEGRLVLVDLNKISAIMPFEEQIDRERYVLGARFKFFVVSVEKTARGPQVVVSRTRPEIVRKLFTLEIPEIASGAVELKAISREAGSRSKIAVRSTKENIDPIGSCVGQRGSRVQTIIAELGGEKIDIIEYSDDPVKFITNALSPAKVLSVETNKETRTAVATVAEDQLSLAIGKMGQNVRLAAQLTGWRIDIKSVTGVAVEPAETKAKDLTVEGSVVEESQNQTENSAEEIEDQAVEDQAVEDQAPLEKIVEKDIDRPDIDPADVDRSTEVSIDLAEDNKDDKTEKGEAALGKTDQTIENKKPKQKDKK